MSYCRVHDGLYYKYEDGCPKCRDDAEQAASDRSEIIGELARSREDIANAAFYFANPGDYNCPSCKFLTLKKGASRCPRCQADPGLQYWAEVETKEREYRAEVERKKQDERLRAMAAEKAAAEEWERGREERERRAFVSDVFSNAFYFGRIGAILGAFVGFCKGCVRYDPRICPDGTNRYGHLNLLEPFWYIPATAFYVFIIGAIIGIIFRVIKGQK